MGWFRKKDDFLQKPPKNAVNYSDAERELQKGDAEDDGNFKYDDKGFTYESPSGPVVVKWADIQNIIAYKTDMSTYDVICITIRWESGGLVLTEEMPGWRRYTEKLKNQFPEINRDWEVKVAFPAFAANETLLYLRPE